MDLVFHSLAVPSLRNNLVWAISEPKMLTINIESAKPSA
jgi:hypothetical protein